LHFCLWRGRHRGQWTRDGCGGHGECGRLLGHGVDFEDVLVERGLLEFFELSRELFLRALTQTTQKGRPACRGLK
jgi:hypothetical protein